MLNFVVTTYDAYNRLATETDARGNVKTHSYEHARGLQLGTTYTLPSHSTNGAAAGLLQPIQWSSEVWDSELGLVYYNWRYYNAIAGRWISRDFIESDISEICFVQNCPIVASDELGLLKMHLLTGKENLFNDTRIDGAFNMHWQFDWIRPHLKCQGI